METNLNNNQELCEKLTEVWGSIKAHCPEQVSTDAMNLFSTIQNQLVPPQKPTCKAFLTIRFDDEEPERLFEVDPTNACVKLVIGKEGQLADDVNPESNGLAFVTKSGRSMRAYLERYDGSDCKVVKINSNEALR